MTVRAFNLVSQLLVQSQQLAKLEAGNASSLEESGPGKRIDDVWGRFLVFTEGYLKCGAGRTEG